MGQIVKRKKKGRPSKADLARRSGDEKTAPESDIRRSLRRRNVRYNIDFDDYVDEDDEDEDGEERRKEKKLKLVLKLPQDSGSGGEAVPRQGRMEARVTDAPDSAVSASSSEYWNRTVKKDGGDDDDDDNDDDDDDGDGDEERGRKADSKGQDSVPGTPSGPPSGVPLPDKKSLELILDKLQKKDTYGVYAEPVDPEELPDYHDVIAHPMDFATVRKKLGNGSYSTLVQFESDVFLICTNAMQYNAPDTIYYKQARSIQELATKKFQKLRIDIERSEKELKSEQKPRSNSLAKKQIRKLIGRTSQEPVGSDFSSGATLATAGDIQNGLSATQAGGCERPSNTDGIVEGNSSLIENNLDKAEELLSGKNLLSKFGRKSLVQDENRRSTYNISNQPVVRSELIFTTFEGENKQLVSVGLHAEYSYARSLARFAATLGPVAWKVASKRIEQALPVGFKFGRGWVGEYEPLPTPVLMLENRTQKGSGTKMQCAADLKKYDRSFNTPVPAKEHPVSGLPLEGKSPLFTSAGGTTMEGKPSLFGSAGTKHSAPVNAIYQQQNPLSRIYADPDYNVLKQVELNHPPAANQNKTGLVAEKQLSSSPEMATSGSLEAVSRKRNLLQSVSFKQLDSNGVVAGGLPNGKVVNNSSDSNKLISSSSDSVPSQVARAATYFPHGQEQGISDPVQLMRMLAENQKQQKPSNHSPVDTSPVMASVPSPRRHDSNNAAAAAARAWMSVGAGGFKPPTENSVPQRNQISADSLYNPARELHPQISRFRGELPASVGMHFQSEKNSFPVHAFAPQPVRMANEAQFQGRPIVFPQLVTADLSRFHVQSPWRGTSPFTQPRQRPETLPPDLNIGFQSSGSPVRQSSGVMVDSQQPDLALQL
ncbi:hypothetical protein L1049_001438 [Liquidambar formosana]|uniref:Bromo domain-containing protein n=1 Tax=Liquidambar formosana TaxID=63359 RepID=A0AAP0NDA7_LIQFO